jgi:hypothetical protein
MSIDEAMRGHEDGFAELTEGLAQFSEVRCGPGGGSKAILGTVFPDIAAQRWEFDLPTGGPPWTVAAGWYTRARVVEWQTRGS